MGLATRFSNGLEVAKTSFKVLNAHKKLIIFPILSGISLLAVIGSFFGFMYKGGTGFNIDNIGKEQMYFFIFLFYIINYFIVVFFNMALMHCAKLYFDGEEVSIAKGLQFSVSRIHTIFLWAVFAATIGTMLRMLQDNLGAIGKFITGLIGIVWGVATFFVIPVLAYENLGPIDAVKRSASLMKERWGEGIGANFSIGLVGFAVMIIVAIISMAVSALVNEQAGIIIFGACFLGIIILGSTLHSIFICAIYNGINGDINEHLNKQLLDNLFVGK